MTARNMQMLCLYGISFESPNYLFKSRHYKEINTSKNIMYEVDNFSITKLTYSYVLSHFSIFVLTIIILFMLGNSN